MGKPLLDFSHLTPDERVQLAGELWESISDQPEEPARKKTLRVRALFASGSGRPASDSGKITLACRVAPTSYSPVPSWPSSATGISGMARIGKSAAGSSAEEPTLTTGWPRLNGTSNVTGK